MKQKLLTNMLAAIVALFTVLFALPQTAQAETTYPLYIAGTKVTSANCGNLRVIPGVSGTVKYNHFTKTLTLDNATINGAGYCIDSFIDDLTVRLIGTNTVTTTTYPTIYHKKPMTLTGGGTLNVQATDGSGIFVSETSLTIDGCTVNVKGTYGITGYVGKSETLTIKNATVTVEGSTYGSILDIKTFTLDGVSITQPAGAVWNGSKKAVCDAEGNVITAKVTIKPVTTYNLTIAGTELTSANIGAINNTNFPNLGLTSGSITYDHSTKTFTLTDVNANVSRVGGNVINITSSAVNAEYKIKLVGNNVIESYYAVINTAKNLTIEGSGSLEATSNDATIYATENRTLTIKNTTVTIMGNFGIIGRDDTSSEKLVIINSIVKATGILGSICYFQDITLDGCNITSPAGAAVIANGTNSKAVMKDGEVVTDEVMIAPFTSYNLNIAGVFVTSANCNDLSVIDGVSGTVNYDPATQTLTLDNATINSGGNIGIDSQIDGITVKLTGTNTVTAGYAAVKHTKPMTLTGGGTLNAQGTSGSGIWLFETSLIIDGCTVNAKGTWGIMGNVGAVETLTIKNATVTAEGTGGSIRYIKTLTLDGVSITQPAGAVWNGSKKAVCDAEGYIITSQVTIAPITTYHLWIAGTQVTSANCNDLSVIDDVSGTVNYDPATQTLTLDNATINGAGYCIDSFIDDLTVRLIGTNTVTTTTYPTIYHKKPMTITGGGTLNVQTTDGSGIFVSETSLTLDGCTVNVKGRYGIAGYVGKSEILTIKNATVTAEGTDGSIFDFKTFTLEGVSITQPAGAVWNPTKKAVCDASGNVITAKVTIDKLSTAIEAVTTDAPAKKQGIYNLHGVRLDNDLDRLPAGVYIVDGKKVVKK